MFSAAAAAPRPLSLNSLMANMFSPSKNPCMIRVPTVNGVSRYRNDPYRALVVPQIAPSPMKCIDTNSLIAPLSATKIANRMRMVAAANAAASAMPSVVAPPAAVPLPMPIAADAELAAPRVVAPCAIEAAAPTMLSKDVRTRYATIKFKHETMMFVAPFKVEVGDVVLTEGDRGQNLGTVTDITTEKPSFNVPMKLIRHADAKEREALAVQRRKEAAAARICQEHTDALGLPMKIVDCEYQADFAKMTIFFTAKTPVDFRKLQRALFKEFRCRIWLCDW